MSRTSRRRAVTPASSPSPATELSGLAADLVNAGVDGAVLKAAQDLKGTPADTKAPAAKRAERRRRSGPGAGRASAAPSNRSNTLDTAELAVDAAEIAVHVALNARAPAHVPAPIPAPELDSGLLESATDALSGAGSAIVEGAKVAGEFAASAGGAIAEAGGEILGGLLDGLCTADPAMERANRPARSSRAYERALRL